MSKSCLFWGSCRTLCGLNPECVCVYINANFTDVFYKVKANIQTHSWITDAVILKLYQMFQNWLLAWKTWTLHFLQLINKDLSSGSSSPVQTVIENTPQSVISAQPIPLWFMCGLFYLLCQEGRELCVLHPRYGCSLSLPRCVEL
jgi:hypothetical protein